MIYLLMCSYQLSIVTNPQFIEPKKLDTLWEFGDYVQTDLHWIGKQDDSYEQTEVTETEESNGEEGEEEDEERDTERQI